MLRIWKIIASCLLVGTLLIGVSPKVLADAKVQNDPKPVQQTQLPKELLRAGYCESRLHQFKPDGTILLGEINPLDVGEFQINTDPTKTDWLAKSISLGYDIYTKAGNEAMALWIYKHYGIQPWFWSYDPSTLGCKNGIIIPSMYY